jgi:hypothetical protein
MGEGKGEDDKRVILYMYVCENSITKTVQKRGRGGKRVKKE